MLLIFLDTETNGLDPSVHLPIEIALKCLNAFTMEELFEYHSHILWDLEDWMFSDYRSLEVNGLSYELLQKRGVEADVIGKAIIRNFKKHGVNSDSAAFVCQNPSFDRIFFYYICPAFEQREYDFPYHWLDLASMYWGKYGMRQPLDTLNLSKDMIAETLGVPPEEKPHGALRGVEHLIQCYKKLQECY